MGIIFVTGIQESGKDEIVDMVLTCSRKNLPPFDYFRFDDLIPQESNSTDGVVDLWSFSNRIKHMHNVQRDFSTKLKKKVDHLKLTGNHIIVNGYFTLKTPGGYLPIISKGSDGFFKPDVIVVMDIDFDNPVMIKKLGKERVKELKYDQDLNLKCAASYATITKSAVNIVRVEYGNLKDALKDMTNAITLALG